MMSDRDTIRCLQLLEGANSVPENGAQLRLRGRNQSIRRVTFAVTVARAQHLSRTAPPLQVGSVMWQVRLTTPAIEKSWWRRANVAAIGISRISTLVRLQAQIRRLGGKLSS
jgi:hypothetical protein